MISEQIKDEVKAFYRFLSCNRKGIVFSCNSKIKDVNFEGFSKNHFISSEEELITYVDENQLEDCYCIINPLKEKTNRQFANLAELTTLGLDIEFKNKKVPETKERLTLLLDIIKKHLIEAFNITKYLLTFSGNGYHLLINIGHAISIKDNLKQGYNKTVCWINTEANLSLANKQGLDDEISVLDRKDMNGILRIPGTTNNKCGRVVKIIESKNEGQNSSIRKAIFRHVNQHKRTLAKNTKKFVINSNSALLPNTFEELESHPLVVALLDTKLDKVTGWNSTVVFAIQAIIKTSGLPYDSQMQSLEAQINHTWGITVSLASCSTDNYMIPVLGAYNFLKQNNFIKYSDELRKLLNLEEDDA